MSRPSRPISKLGRLAERKKRDNSLPGLLECFTSDPLADEASKTESRQLYNLIASRNTTFQGKFHDTSLGLLFGMNAFLLDMEEGLGFLQAHKREPLLIPSGGKFEKDDPDPLAVALREALQETGNDKNIRTSPLYQYKENLLWLDQPVLDVHTQPNIIESMPGDTWWYLTVGLKVPSIIRKVVTLPYGRWYPLQAITRSPDVSTARAAAHALRVLAAQSHTA